MDVGVWDGVCGGEVWECVCVCGGGGVHGHVTNTARAARTACPAHGE